MADRMPGVEIGQEGLDSFAGRVTEPYVADLEWPQAYKVYNEMRRRDPTLRSLMNAIRLLARDAQWKAEPASDGAADRAAAEFLDECLGDMSHSVSDFLDDVLTMLPFGWSSFEVCYKRRARERGAGNRGAGSLFEDGKIGWRKLAYRRQSSWDEWLFDAAGGFQGWVQRVPPDYTEVTLPIDKLLHFVAERDGNNPEGISLFESAYEPYHFITNLQIIMGIGWQRTFVGLPVFEFAEGMRPQSDDLDAVKTVGQGLVVDERQYVSVPPGVTFRLVSTQNAVGDALLSTIKYFRTVILQIVLADFIALGSGERGSWALGSDKSAIFLMTVNSLLDRIAENWTRYGVSRLFEYNDFPGMTAPPRMTHTPIYKVHLTALGSFIQQVAQYIRLGDEDVLWIRQQAGMPEILNQEAGNQGAGSGETGSGESGEEEEEEEGEDGEELAELGAGQEEGRAGLEERLTRDMAGMLKDQRGRLEEALATYGVEGLDAAWWEAERARAQGLLTSSWMNQLRALVEIVLKATEESLGSADWELINKAAVQWAREFVGREIKGITETTRGLVREQVAAWVETGQELPALRRALEPTFGRTRAELIATTEVTRAFAEANDLTWQGMGLPAMAYKPPAHPRCRCWARPARVGDRWVVVWETARDERVCQVPLEVPWGTAAGCGDLHGRVISVGDDLGKLVREIG